jgi:hypothetical protein
MKGARAVLLYLAASTAWSLPSAAQEDRLTQCIESYESGQRLKKTGDLVEAASRLAYCAHPICPARMREDCAARLQEVKAATPSLVLTVSFEGAPAAVRVSIDGQGRVWAPDASRLIVNPGRHELRVEAEGFKTQTSVVLIGEGEQAVPVEFRFSSGTAEPQGAPVKAAGSGNVARSRTTPADPSPQLTGHSHAALWVTASSAIGAAGFIYFGLAARRREAELESQCAPSCSASQVSEVRRDYLLANVGLGLGLASLVTGGLMFLVQSHEPPANGAQAATVRVRVSPSAVALEGAF